ncbi:glycoside hydrolase family 130 protein [Catellatospora citrea]|uniref:glycoside hydrolase family 130 protein n=1 Tax=Catellatospora citrea TaxID=53366 RepID=UPI0033C3A48A
MTAAELAVRHDVTLEPDPRRVILKLFVPGEDAALARTRASGLVERITALDDDAAARLLDEVMHGFGSRHHELAATFRHHFDLVRHRVSPERELPPTMRTLIGAFFSHEYAVEAAALCNPSMVEHPDQSGLADGQLRVAISLRQIGEGHLSSIGFATAVLGPGGDLALAPRPGPLTVGTRVSPAHRRDLLAAGLNEEAYDDEVSATVLGLLPERFDDQQFEQTLARIPPDLLHRATAQRTVEQLRRTIADGYSVVFPDDVPLSRRVLWPNNPSESNGMEDARFVRVTGEDGAASYRATYTAYDGRQIASRMLDSADLTRFEVTPMRGPGARNKGVALFPRPIEGRHVALCRSDGETLGLTVLDGDNRWGEPVPLLRPGRTWSLIQVGNCGSPLETDAGWLVLTHGVGPMRQYAIGAILLDLHQPERVIAELPGVLLAPAAGDRDGYVPNVVYSCGGLLHQGTLWLPYGASDARVGFATVGVTALLDAMREA